MSLRDLKKTVGNIFRIAFRLISIPAAFNVRMRLLFSSFLYLRLTL